MAKKKKKKKKEASKEEGKKEKEKGKPHKIPEFISCVEALLSTVYVCGVCTHASWVTVKRVSYHGRWSLACGGHGRGLMGCSLMDGFVGGGVADCFSISNQERGTRWWVVFTLLGSRCDFSTCLTRGCSFKDLGCVCVSVFILQNRNLSYSLNSSTPQTWQLDPLLGPFQALSPSLSLSLPPSLFLSLSRNNQQSPGSLRRGREVLFSALGFGLRPPAADPELSLEKEKKKIHSCLHSLQQRHKVPREEMWPGN